MKRLIYCVVGCFLCYNLYAIGLADFVPNFLTVKNINKKSTASSTTVMQNPDMNGIVLSTKSLNIATNSSGYCDSNNATAKSSVFCRNVGAESTIVQSSSESVDSQSSNFRNDTKPNLNAMQSSDLRSAIGKYGSGYVMSIKPSTNMDIGIGTTERGVNALQFNMKY